MRWNKSFSVVAIAAALGASIAYVDTRPGWDDTGITAGALFFGALILSAVCPRMALVVALAVGAWIPVVEIMRDGNVQSILALVVAVVGALCGAAGRTLRTAMLR